MRRAVVFVLAAAAGCGDRVPPQPPMPVTYTVRGAVTWKGRPAPANTLLTLASSDEQAIVTGVPLAGEGRYEAKGVLPGEYVLEAAVPDADGVDRLNGAYATGRTPFKFKVSGDRTFDIDLK